MFIKPEKAFRRGVIMFSRKKPLLIIMALLIMTGLNLAPAQTTAQEEPTVRVIPVPGEMFGAALSPDGRWLFIYESTQIHEDEIVPDYLPLRLIDLDSGEERLLTGHTDYAYEAAFSPDSQRIASYHGNGDLLIWDVASGTITQRLLAIPGGGRVAFLADGQSVVTLFSGTSTQMAIWDLATGHITQLLAPRFDTRLEFMDTLQDGLPDRVVAFISSPDGSVLWAVTMYVNLERWDIATSEATRLRSSAYDAPMLSSRNVDLLADGRTLVFFDGRESILTLFDVTTGADVMTLPIDTLIDPVVWPDGSQLAWIDTNLGLNLVVMPLDEAAVAGAAEPLLIPLTTDYGNPRRAITPNLQLSQDGRRLLVTGFVVLDTGDNAVIVVDFPE
jgi:WD40 repeat protein